MANHHSSFKAVLLLTLIGVTGGDLAANEHWHVYDALGNTVASVNADAIAASIESTAFGESRGPTAGARFTGKPYDADLGAHVFPFRNYRSDSARWTSADPSGFPDGVNGTAYASVPTFSLDPLGLAQVTSKSFTTNGTLENLAFTIIDESMMPNVGDPISFAQGAGAFSIPTGHEATGWVIQKTTFNYSYKMTETSELIDFNLSYWEAWGVSVVSGKAIIVASSLVPGGPTVDGLDIFRTDNFSNTYSGSATITGVAYFHPFVSGGPQNPDLWSTTAIPQSGGLPAVLAADAPSWLPTGDGVSHQLTLMWE